MKKLDIEIEKLDRMTMTGSSILKLYPDQHTPILDLLVRESIQNSLDAAVNSKTYVQVDFITGDFKSTLLDSSLDGIRGTLRKGFPSASNRYLAIKDKYTEGLTGALDINEVQNYQYGNLIKLVYDICKPQDIAGSGGSWGLGKTIYFRLGIGLVFYYSRIFDTQKKCYESRLAGILVEDENSASKMIPQKGKGLNSGVAWWGKSKNSRTIPVTDNNTIQEFLKIFNIEPYSEEETGTTIIIPFIDEQKILQNNQLEETEDNTSNAISTIGSIDSYLALATQRWYFPRLNNTKYPFGQYLKVYINGNRIKKDDMLPIFQAGQALYNRAINQKNFDDDFLEENKVNVSLDEIRVNKVLVAEDCCAGYLASACITKETLGMCPPNSNLTPYHYFALDESENELNRPIFCFCRKPGMIVSFMDEDTKWTYGVPSSDKSSYIISIFILNSKTRLRDINLDLEEYVRKSELANHTRWEDYTYNNEKRSIISKIKKNVARKLYNLYSDAEQTTEETKIVSGLGQMMTNLILPPEGFGKKANKRQYANTDHRTEYSRNKTFRYTYLNECTEYNRNSLKISYYIKSTSTTKHFNVCSYINSESGIIDFRSWETSGMEIPYEIKEISMEFKKIDDNDSIRKAHFSGDKETQNDDLLSIKWLNSMSGTHYGFETDFVDFHTFELKLTIKLNLNSRDLQPLLKIE